MEKGIDDDTVSSGDEHDTQDLEDETNGTSGTKGGCVLDDEEEAVPGRGAEVLGGEGDLNVGIFGDEFDESFKAVEAAASGAEDCLNDFVFLVGLFDLLFIVLEYNSDELNKSNQESTHCQRAKMVSVHPVDTLHNRARAIGISSACEVPLSASCSNYEDQTAHEEGIDPKVPEQRVKKCIPSIFFPFNLSEKFEILPLLLFTYRAYKEGSDQPNNQPNHCDKSSDWWHQENLRSRLKEISRGFHDCDTDPDVPAVAAKEDDQQSKQTPYDI